MIYDNMLLKNNNVEMDFCFRGVFFLFDYTGVLYAIFAE